MMCISQEQADRKLHFTDFRTTNARDVTLDAFTKIHNFVLITFAHA